MSDEQPLLSDVLPAFAEELRQLLFSSEESQLAGQVRSLRIVDRCRCGDNFCSTFYVRPKPSGAYGPDHRSVPLTSAEGMVILDVVGEEIVCIEVLYRPDVQNAIRGL